MRRSGGLSSAGISVALFDENKAAACAWIGVGAQRGSGRLFKGASRAEQGARGRLRTWPVRTRGGVWLRHEVGERPDEWARVVSGRGGGTKLSACAAREGEGSAHGLLG